MGVVTDACNQSVGANSYSVGVSACATAKPETQGGLRGIESYQMSHF